MDNWFECKVRYDKMMENGIQKTVTEPYLVDALDFTEAEARIIEEIKPYISGDFTVSDIKRVKFADTFLNESGDRYYKAKLYFLTLDEKTGGEKRTAVNMLVQASTLLEAVNNIEAEMKKTMIDYVLAGVNETAIMDVFPYSANVQKLEDHD